MNTHAGPVRPPSIAVIVPCYQVERTIATVLAAIGPESKTIICVDDASTDSTADVIKARAATDLRITLIRREANGGVGAATVDGYRAAVLAGADILVKLDADGQMDATLIPELISPIVEGRADYTKGNRFYSLEAVRAMPAVRLWGNAALSFLTKLSTGYWNLFDPSNGFTAIHANVVAALPLSKLHKRYFFEADMLFRLATVRAKVTELPMNALYGDETSHLSVTATLMQFPILHMRNFIKRIFYNHFLRNFSVASVNLLAGLALVLFGVVFGALEWGASIRSGVPASAGTVMLSGLPVLVGIQLLLSFLAYDIAMLPDRTVHPSLNRARSAVRAGWTD